ncbi:MAG: hypothetical protein GSR87_02845 [Desulfurococcales archaeon]|nr:hypothetical protein [Desulfurococcales archaeon]
MKVRLSIPLLGINWGQTVNPYIAVPLENNISVHQVECRDGENSGLLKISLEGQNSPFLEQEISKASLKMVTLYRSLAGDIPGKNCYEISIPDEKIPYISIYGAVLDALAYKLLSLALGLKPSKNEIIEFLSHLWTGKPFWLRLLYESVALSSITGRTILYRGTDESIILGKTSIKKAARRNYYDANTVEPPSDPQLQSALAKLEGVSVISASNIISASPDKGLEIHSLLSTYYKIDNAVSYIVYGLEPPVDGCKYIQSLNGGLEETCFE